MWDPVSGWWAGRGGDGRQLCASGSVVGCQLPTSMLADSLLCPHRLPQDTRTLLPSSKPRAQSGLCDCGEGEVGVVPWMLHLRDPHSDSLARHVYVQAHPSLPWVKKQVFTFPGSNPFS